MSEAHELRIRIKIDTNEFEAEGSAESVERQIGVFERLIGKEVATPTPPPPLNIQAIMAVSANIVLLKVAAKPEDAVLLMLLGQKMLRQNDSVSGTEIMSGLRASRAAVQRCDLLLHRRAAQGLVVASGKRRRRRYRLTTDGFNYAQKVAHALIQSQTVSKKPKATPRA